MEPNIDDAIDIALESLNSTMFRWNYYDSNERKGYIQMFKFHYVQMERKKAWTKRSKRRKFKFHYVQMEQKFV